MRVGIVGCGIVGAAIAHRLSRDTDWQITVWDQRAPDQWQATGAALGVLMAILRTKLKGKHLRLGLASLQLYETLIPELEAATGFAIPYNRRGILHLCFDSQEWIYWQKTQSVRHKQGFVLEHLSYEQLIQQFPEMAAARRHPNPNPVVGAVYSPQDRQLDPQQVTRALIAAATQKGVTFRWQESVQTFEQTAQDPQAQDPQAQDPQTRVTHVATAQGSTSVDLVVVAAGLGAQALTARLASPIAMQPVLGQAFSVKELPQLPQDYPVINGNDVHLYPRPDGSWGIGATVEFPDEGGAEPPEPSPAQLQAIRASAIALFPPLADAEIQHTWSGLRPRPNGRAAPIIERLPGYQNVIAATGHYRNGVLMAPVTATQVLELGRAIASETL